ncbi:MAG: hypothetical protein IJ375_03315 [Oscillospiraceae bacterium]|nr:hypothetical protein [Oscillospiraceae bacterium]
MKISVKPNLLKYLALGAGALGLLLRWLLYATGTDDQGMLLRSHPSQYLLWLLSAAALAGAYLLTRSITGPERYDDCFHTSALSGVGCLLAAAGILITTISNMSDPPDSVTLIMWILGYGAAAALAVAGFCRLAGMKPSFLFYVVLSAYFAVRMVCQYRQWSSDPQLQDYCYQLLACVALMITAYHHAAFGTELGSHKSLWFFSLAAVFLCCLCLAGPGDQLFYLGSGIWAFTGLSSLTPRARRQRPDLNLEESAPEEE